jgi:hypothetical protein
MQGRSIAGRNDASAAWMAAGEALRSFVQVLIDRDNNEARSGEFASFASFVSDGCSA